MEAAHIPWRPLGELLVEHGVLTHAELELALAEQERTGKKLGEIILEHGFASGPAVTRALAEQWGLEASSESGFGTGLWSEIERRHKEKRDHDPDSDEPAREHLVIEFPGGVVRPLRPDHGEQDELEAQLDERTKQVTELEDTLSKTRGELAQLRSRLATAQPAAPEPAPTAHVLFVAGASGYELLERDGPPPETGARVELEDGDVQLVAKVARSPLPGDRRPCAYLEPVPPPTPDE
jgi:uncharacterized coiled-coil protein SlyX